MRRKNTIISSLKKFKRIDEYNKADEVYKTANKEYYKILEEISTDIPKKYGFSKAWRAKEDEKNGLNTWIL